jgi:hypothetical protein
MSRFGGKKSFLMAGTRIYVNKPQPGLQCFNARISIRDAWAINYPGLAIRLTLRNGVLILKQFGMATSSKADPLVWGWTQRK